jgi:hypothetical protein
MADDVARAIARLEGPGSDTHAQAAIDEQLGRWTKTSTSSSQRSRLPIESILTESIAGRTKEPF